MTPEELMQPRYRIVADYPGNNRPIGFLFIMDAKDSEGLYTTTGYLQESFFTKYPHLFQKMGWWEERGIGEIPAYLKRSSDRRIEKVTKHFTSQNSRGEWIDERSMFIGENGIAKPYWAFLPATEQEYINSKRAPQQVEGS